MMYPNVNKSDGRMVLVWTGMLIDWEMSKPILATAARQPGCTVRTTIPFHVVFCFLTYTLGNVAVHVGQTSR